MTISLKLSEREIEELEAELAEEDAAAVGLDEASLNAVPAKIINPYADLFPTPAPASPMNLGGFELEGLVRTILRQQQSAVRQLENAGARLFEVYERWAAHHIMADAKVKVVDDAFSFDIAMREPEISIVFVPSAHKIPPEMLSRLCARAPRSKTIFIDTSAQ